MPENIKVYSKKKSGLVKVFFEVSNGEVQSVTIGDQVVVKEQGFQFYVDDYVADQIYKCTLYMDGFTPKLVAREGEIINEPEKTEKELEIERLRRELEALEEEELEEENGE